MRREEEASRNAPQPALLTPSSASTTGSGTISIFAFSQQSGASSPLSDGTSSSSSTSSAGSSTDSLLRRMGSRIAKSSRRGLESIGLKSRKESSENLSGDESNIFEEMQKRMVTSSPESTSAKTQGSIQSDQSSMLKDKPRLLRRVKSERPELTSNRHSMMSLSDSAHIALAKRPGHSKSPSWSAGPTKSAKEGIAREWESLSRSVEIHWQNEGELGGSQNPRELGRELLFTQLDAQMPYWAVMDAEGTQEVGEMLVGRWIESGRVRKRMAEWDDLVNTRKAAEETVEEGDMAMRFHFSRR
jgi:hypothetical protein